MSNDTNPMYDLLQRAKAPEINPFRLIRARSLDHILSTICITRYNESLFTDVNVMYFTWWKIVSFVVRAIET